MVYQSLRKRRPEGFLLCDGTLEVGLNSSGLVSHFARIANLIDNAGWIAVVERMRIVDSRLRGNDKHRDQINLGREK